MTRERGSLYFRIHDDNISKNLRDQMSYSIVRILQNSSLIYFVVVFVYTYVNIMSFSGYK